MGSGGCGKKGEIWKDVPGYEKLYQVSDLGRVRKRKKQNVRYSWGRKKPRNYYWKIIKPWVNKSGLVVGLWKNNKRSMRCVRMLVAEAFLPGRGRVIFKNGNETDCRRANLARTWMKRSAKLTEVQIYKIWDTFSGEKPPHGTLSKLAKEFAVTPKTILDWKRKMPEDWALRSVKGGPR